MNLFFIPDPKQLPIHPETREPLMKPETAYSMHAVEQLCKESGIDYIDGQIVTLDCARSMRKRDVIRGFVILKHEG